ncbi:DUF1983 domain-containing protein, partial [Glaesserella parasuis]|uniref:phage tail protein n=1 Tax=Glaesserella parasuis TaxID=738 RepID=UPI0013652166
EVTSGNGTVKYDIKVLKDGKLYLFKRDESSSELNLADLANGEYQVTIIARDSQGRMLSEKVQSFTIDNPPTPKNVSVSGGLSDITLSWDFVDEATQTEIWASSTNNLANAERIAKVTANIYTHNVGPRQTRYYWLRHTRGINVGDWYQQQGLSAETGADIDAELALLNEKLSQNIIEEVFDTAMPARKLEMIKTVARIDNPTENIGHKQLYNEADGKLYIWDGNKYTAKIQAVDLEGKLASSQLDQALVNQLTQASSTANNALSKANTVQSALAQEVTQRTQAIQAETRARTTAISAEATARTQALQAEANARGSAVNRLEQVDRDQAQLITTATAKADNALSGLSEERQARIAGDNAESQARTALTARVANTEGSVTTLSQSLSTHTRNLSEITQSLNSRVGGINLFSVVNANFVESLMHRLVTKTVISEKDEHFKLVIKDTGVFNIIIDNTLKAYFPTLKLGDKYVLSLEIKASKVGRLARIGVILGDYSTVSESRNVDVNLDWRVIEVPVVVSSIDQQLYQLLLLRFENWQVDDWAEIRNVQLQKGEKATAFSRSSLLTQAELTNHKSTQAEVDRVQSEQLVTHTARLGAAEATISSTSRTVTTLDGKVQSMHTIQAVSIAGNRKALAGISLGSNGGTESSVIVMADKFNVVKNAQDGNITPMFSVVNNKVAINGDLMADGIISARMMAANSIAAGSIQGGAIRANHIAVGEISAEKLASEAVTTEKIRSNTITSDKIGAGQIITNHMVAGSIDGKILRAGTVTADKVVASVSLQSPVIRGGILEVGRLIGGNLYEVKSFTPGARNQMSITIKPSIAQRLLKMTWDYGTVRFSGNSAAIGGTGDWVTSIKNSAGTVSQHLKGFYTLVIPSNTQVTLSLTFNTTRIMNQILVETVVYSGSSYIQ